MLMLPLVGKGLGDTMWWFGRRSFVLRYLSCRAERTRVVVVEIGSQVGISYQW